jgi:hypothetical protein
MVYALPLICIALQDEMMLPLEGGEGPLGLIICPSRELANQTVEVITQFTEAIKTVSLCPQTMYGLAWGPWLCAVFQRIRIFRTVTDVLCSTRFDLWTKCAAEW